MKTFDRSLPMALYRTLDAVMPRFRSIFGQFGLTEQQWRVLRALWDRDHQSLTEIAESTLISAPSLVGVIDRLERGGFVARERSEQDRRVVRVGTTAQGKALEATVTPLVEAAYADLESTIQPDQWAQMLNTLALIAAKAR